MSRYHLGFVLTDVGDFILFDSRSFLVQVFTYAFADSSFHYDGTSHV